jgi:hypothetical protein
MKRKLLSSILIAVFLYWSAGCSRKVNPVAAIPKDLKSGFLNPPDSAKPGVYWYFMDGNLNRESITADLESMKTAGIGNVIFLEVNVGVPRGKVDFLSAQWQELFVHAVKECERLDIEMTLGIGPGWTGSGGPWVKASESMQHLVANAVQVDGDNKKKIMLPVPKPMPPYFGEGGFTEELKKQWNDFYKDVAVLAYPTPSSPAKIKDVEEKALYYRAPYSSAKGIKQYLAAPVDFEAVPAGSVIPKDKIIDLTSRLRANGELDWDVPNGKWTVVRYGLRNNGAVTRPAPYPGLGFEADKFDTLAIGHHLDQYIGTLLNKIGNRSAHKSGGLKRLHMDSWEVGAQNWTGNFREEFMRRRGYDPLPYYPAYAGNIVESLEISERFLWDLRQTSQELVLENHAGYVKKYAHRNGMNLSIEPYDMNPNADLELGAVADVPMCEFWSAEFGYNTSFSCIEAVSIAHVNGQSLVPAEAFTAESSEGWKQHPASMKNQGDWAFAAGINRFVFHTFQNQVLPDSLKPGMTMGPYGVHWDRSQTWWPLVGDYHRYLSRSQHILQQGSTVADVLYLTPEGSPHVFRPPFSALTGTAIMPDRKGYNFDGCAPGQLYNASVKDGRIVFPGGASYRILVLPAVKTIRPKLLEKIMDLVAAGAVVVGSPPVKSLGLTGYPEFDVTIKDMAKELWGSLDVPAVQTEKVFKKGKVIYGGDLETRLDNLYPAYELTASLLKSMNIDQDFESDGPVRYTHRQSANWDVYFVSNSSDQRVNVNAVFRSVKGNVPELWDPLTGSIRELPDFTRKGVMTAVPLQFEPHQSFFVVFSKNENAAPGEKQHFAMLHRVFTLDGSWKVFFDPKWGGPGMVDFGRLQDWILNEDKGIRYYSGTAVYKKTFDLPLKFEGKKEQLFLDLGEVRNLARVKLNGKDLGALWTAPWRVDISTAVRSKDNQLEIEVVNLWPNRLIGDEFLPDDGIKDGQWPEWLTKGLPRSSGRYTFTTIKHYNKTSPLLKSGLTGPVVILKKE